VIGIAAAPDGKGYWLAAADGGVFSFGSAPFEGSMGATPLNAPIVSIAPFRASVPGWAPTSDGYFLVSQYPGSGSTWAFGPIMNVTCTGTVGAFGHWLTALERLADFPRTWSHLLGRPKSIDHYADAFALRADDCFRMIMADDGTGHAHTAPTKLSGEAGSRTAQANGTPSSAALATGPTSTPSSGFAD
jgi:hypothetical protein